ncbi:hypothetical protein E4U55_004540 [Claviceps digitariae]|nr:hypothetical protein E4U55_004540 [Claviceps digitariae]
MQVSNGWREPQNVCGTTSLTDVHGAAWLPLALLCFRWRIWNSRSRRTVIEIIPNWDADYHLSQKLIGIGYGDPVPDVGESLQVGEVESGVFGNAGATIHTPSLAVSLAVHDQSQSRTHRVVDGVYPSLRHTMFQVGEYASLVGGGMI